MPEYWKLPEQTARTLVGGWLHTADASYLDDAGYVHITDRLKGLILCVGENIYPAEIEHVLLEHSQLSDAAVVGVRDERWGEVPLAYVVKRPGAELTQGAALGYVRKRVAAFKLPRAVQFIDALPGNSTGKILKRVLREPHWAAARAASRLTVDRRGRRPGGGAHRARKQRRRPGRKSP